MWSASVTTPTIRYYEEIGLLPQAGRSPAGQRIYDDSDLERLVSREAGLKLVFLRDRAPLEVRANDSFNLSFLHYQRSNGLSVELGTLGYARSF